MDKRLAILGLLALTSVICLAEDDPGRKKHHTSSIIPTTASSTTIAPSPSNSTAPPSSSATHSSSKTATPSHSSSKTVEPTPSKSTTVTPSPSPSPSPAAPQYILTDPKNKSRNCIVLDANITFLIGYNTTTKDAKTKKTLYKYKYLSIPLVNGTVNTSNSYCQSSTGEYDGDFTGQLEVTWEYENQDYRVDFMFSGSTNDSAQQWVLSTTTVHIPGDVFNASEAVHPINGSQLEAKSYKVMDQKLDYQRSYMCNTKRNVKTFVTNTSSVANYYNMTIIVSEFQVQAFEFNDKNTNNGLFDPAASCHDDSQDNKIVPIAVGAALAGLVIIVLIAYIIGRLRSRKQSSYEALS